MRKISLTVGLGEGHKPADSVHDGLQGDPEVRGSACRDWAAGRPGPLCKGLAGERGLYPKVMGILEGSGIS